MYILDFYILEGPWKPPLGDWRPPFKILIYYYLLLYYFNWLTGWLVDDASINWISVYIVC